MLDKIYHAVEDFYPRPPRGGRPAHLWQAAPHFVISIHALREEGDMGLRSMASLDSNFYPRPPRGGRRFDQQTGKELTQFLSTPSARRATTGDSLTILRNMISIHALREEGDFLGTMPAASASIFLSTPSARRATSSAVRSSSLVRFLSTPSARRATGSPRSKRPRNPYFYPRPPRGGRQQKQRQNLYFQTNYTTFCTNLEEL